MLLDLLESTKTLSVFLSDAAKYMVAAGVMLKSLYRKLFHVTRVAHL